MDPSETRDGAHGPMASHTEKRWRFLLIASACCLSIGTHFGSYVLGPLKRDLLERLGASETDFAALIGSFELINSLTPLVGFLIPKWGLPLSSVLSTSTIFLGQLLALFGSATSSVLLMVLGLFLSGVGASPVAVVQESVILWCVGPNQRGKGVAVGLLLGKLSSWVASVTAVPLSRSPLVGHSAPFFVSTTLSLFSVLASLTFSLAFRVLAPEPANATRGATTVKLRETIRLGDAFWCYIVTCAASGGLWFPFIHLSTDLLATFFDTSSGHAALFASAILFFTLFLYPTFGWLLDRSSSASPRAFFRLRSLLVACTLLTCITLVILLAPGLRAVMGLGGSVLPFALGRGLAPLLLVLLASDVVPTDMLSTALGLHKAVEMAAATLVQTICSLFLRGIPVGDTTRRKRQASKVVALLMGINGAELIGAYILLRLERAPNAPSNSSSAPAPGATRATEDREPNETDALLPSSPTRTRGRRATPVVSEAARDRKARHQKRLEKRMEARMLSRGRIGLSSAVFLVVGSWVAFIWALVVHKH